MKPKYLADPMPLADALRALVEHSTAKTLGAGDWQRASEALAVYDAQHIDADSRGARIEDWGVPVAEVRPLVATLNSLFYALHLLRGEKLVLDGSRDGETLQRLGNAALQPLAHFEREVAGVVRALLRAHAAAGGSHRERATLMQVTRDTAVGRLRVVENSQPDQYERWATGTDQPAAARQEIAALKLRPGYSVIHRGRVSIVEQVEVRYGTLIPREVFVTTTRNDVFERHATHMVEASVHEQPYETFDGTTTSPEGATRKVTIYRATHFGGA